MKRNTAAPPLIPKRIPFEHFLKQFGRTRATGHRWRRLLPWLEVQNIFGRLYISLASVQRFEEMAARGELAVRMGPPPGRGRKGKSARAAK
jgi:hypothetical protein